ncbi:MAG: GNAT family N-acetyltransferase [Candidatus Bathyarchaeota archaeon]|nr:GNAT family N-acetyltransferase [Candidatus Bathyarchaeota archaeon]
MRRIEKLEEFWRSFVLASGWGEDVDGAVVTWCSDLPMHTVNHATDISVDRDEAEDLIDRVTTYFLSRGFPYVCFRISPLTRLRSLTSLLEDRGFEKKEERSIMVYRRGSAEDKMNPGVEVREISKSEMGVWVDIVFAAFGWPTEWKAAVEKRFVGWMGRGGKCYLAYIEGKPVGACVLISLVDTGRIFAVGTLEKYRRRGVGTTLTVRAVMDSIRQGNRLHTLEAVKGGSAERLYEKMGFVTDHAISYYVKELCAT